MSVARTHERRRPAASSEARSSALRGAATAACVLRGPPHPLHLAAEACCLRSAVRPPWASSIPELEKTTALFEFNRNFGPVPGVGQLSFERAPGLICARDGNGKLVMRIATGPGFGQRLATAFYDYRQAMHEVARYAPLSNESGV